MAVKILSAKEIPFEKLKPRQQKFIDLYVMTGEPRRECKASRI